MAKTPRPLCVVSDCILPVRSAAKVVKIDISSPATIYCNGHYMRHYKYGDVMEAVPLKQQIPDPSETAEDFTKLCRFCSTVKPLIEFYTRTKRGKKTYMSECKECKKDAVRKRKISLLYGAEYDKTITKKSLIKKLGLLCYYCKEQMTTTSRSLERYDPRLVTIEHLIPISLGGTHTQDNVVLACWECNSKKNNKTVNQFLNKEGVEDE